MKHFVIACWFGMALAMPAFAGETQRRAALLTGRMPARNGAEENHSYPRENILRLPRILNRLGYQTAAFGKVAHLRSAPDYGFDIIDLLKDPEEHVNLAGKPELADIQRDLRDELGAWIKAQGDKLTVFHEPLMLDAPETWVPRK